MKILVVNGPNLNLLGTREPNVYGSQDLKQIEQQMREYAHQHQVELRFEQSNYEGLIIETLHKAMGVYDFIILNAGAYTHYSIAIRDAISAIKVPVIEVHMSNIYAREEFRHKSILAPVTVGQICGFGTASYILAIKAALLLGQEGNSNVV
ncbi:type II 3-dehydroquinate dehydratase [Bacillota bacterium LX-D]|nr:type II 3-dehydroquinate dehydratase [Bacillota bacterium LX-D]